MYVADIQKCKSKSGGVNNKSPYLNYSGILQGKTLHDIDFRSKRYGWKHYCLELRFKIDLYKV